MKKLLLLLFTVLLFANCKDTIFHNPTICDSTVFVEVPVLIDSVVFHDSLAIREIIVFRDSSVIKDTIRLIETGKGNLKISGAKQNATFYIDLDSIRVMIRNDSILDIWQRPAKQ